MDVGGPLSTLASHLRPSWLFPSFGIGAEGEAWLCTDDHVPIYTGTPHPPAPVHIDVLLRLWNKTQVPITLFDVLSAVAAAQELRPEEPGYLGAFQEATLEVGGRRVEERFELHPPNGETLPAKAGERLLLRLRTSRGRPRTLKFDLGGRG